MGVSKRYSRQKSTSNSWWVLAKYGSDYCDKRKFDSEWIGGYTSKVEFINNWFYY